MRNTFLWFAVVVFFSFVAGKSEFFPEDDRELEEIAKFLRKRVEEVEAAEEGSDFEEFDSDPEVQSQRKEYNQPFEFKLPSVLPENEDSQPFAVGPFDPRYYQDFGRPVKPASGVVETVAEATEKISNEEDSKKKVNDEITTEFHDLSPSYIRQIPLNSVPGEDGKADIYFTAVVAGCSAAAVVATIAIGIGCYRLQKNTKAAAEVDYPAYGVTGPNKDVSPTSGDRRLAQSAQMYHYQHQKQQIIAMESMGNKERRSSVSDAESEEENEEGDYTVYECPGLASTGEMEVKNPLFQDDQTPASKTAENSTDELQELPK